MQRVNRVGAAHLHVSAEVVAPVVAVQRGEHVCGVGRERVGGAVRNHVPYHKVRVDFVAELDRQRRRDEFVVQCGECLLGRVLQLAQLDWLGSVDVRVVHQAQTVQVAKAHAHGGHVYLVEGEPVLDLVLVAGEYRARVGGEQVDGGAVKEAVVLGDNPPRDFVVAEGDKRLYAMRLALVKHLVIEGQSRLIGHAGIVREDARPVDGKPEALKAHLRKERDVFFVVVVKVYRLMAGIERIRVRPRQEGARRVHVSAQQHVRHGKRLAVLQIRTLALIGGHCTAPQKVLWKSHSLHSLR